jgi:5-methylcytosine-specific restriction endonuclease McrA
MQSDVLVLNRSFYAIHITSWQKALSLVYLDHASVVDQEYRTYSFEDWRQMSLANTEIPSGFVHTPNFKIAIPDVIALKVFDRLPTTEVKFTRRNIYEHYAYRCCYCGVKFSSQDLNLEHVHPKSRGGKTGWDNIVTACVKCNLKKGDKLLHETDMKLLIKPTKPKWRGVMSLVFQSPVKMRSSWQRFIDNAYWNLELETTDKS